MSRPLTRKEWLAFLEKACDEFDWESAGQKREWVGLTDEELKPICDENHIMLGAYAVDFIRAIEAKLKEKNT